MGKKNKIKTVYVHLYAIGEIFSSEKIDSYAVEEAIKFRDEEKKIKTTKWWWKNNQITVGADETKTKY